MKFKNQIPQQQAARAERAGHIKIPRVWIVVADSRIARVFRKTDSHLELVGEAFPTRRHRERGMPDNSMGRVTSLHGSAHHKLTPHSQPGRADAENFAHDLSGWLEEAVQADSFDRLVLVAAPKTLGDIRPRLPKAVQDRVMAEVNKELTKMNEKELFEELKDIVWF